MTKVIYKDTNWETEYDYSFQDSPNLTKIQIKLKKAIRKNNMAKLNQYISKLLKDPNNPLPINYLDSDKMEIDHIDDPDFGCYDFTINFKDTTPIEVFITNNDEIKLAALKMFIEIQKITNNSYLLFIEDFNYPDNTGFFIEKEGLFPSITNMDTWIKPSYSKLKNFIPLNDYINNNKDVILDSITKTNSSLKDKRGNEPPNFTLNS